MVYVVSWSPSSFSSSLSARSQPLPCAQDIWLDRLVVAGAAGRSSPEGSVVLGVGGVVAKTTTEAHVFIKSEGKPKHFLI